MHTYLWQLNQVVLPKSCHQMRCGTQEGCALLKASEKTASLQCRAEMEDTEACAPGAAGSRASVGLQEDDEAAFVGPPPPPMMLPPLRDQGANAESMESAEAPQPMSLSGPGRAVAALENITRPLYQHGNDRTRRSGVCDLLTEPVQALLAST